MSSFHRGTNRCNLQGHHVRSLVILQTGLVFGCDSQIRLAVSGQVAFQGVVYRLARDLELSSDFGFTRAVFQ